jgi:hypothetical protein
VQGPNWKESFLTSKHENGEIALQFSDELPPYLETPVKRIAANMPLRKL